MSEAITRILDAWVCQAVASSFLLVGLYRKLDDGLQASRALRAGQAPLERVQRLGLGGGVQMRLHGLRGLPSEEEAELRAWRTMIASLGGLATFYALAESGRQGRSCQGLRGHRNAMGKGLAEAIKGFRTAYPEETAEQGIESALEGMVSAVADALIQAADEEVDPTGRAELRVQVRQTFQSGIMG